MTEENKTTTAPTEEPTAIIEEGVDTSTAPVDTEEVVEAVMTILDKEVPEPLVEMFLELIETEGGRQAIEAYYGSDAGYKFARQNHEQFKSLRQEQELFEKERQEFNDEKEGYDQAFKGEKEAFENETKQFKADLMAYQTKASELIQEGAIELKDEFGGDVEDPAIIQQFAELKAIVERRTDQMISELETITQRMMDTFYLNAMRYATEMVPELTGLGLDVTTWQEVEEDDRNPLNSYITLFNDSFVKAEYDPFETVVLFQKALEAIGQSSRVRDVDKENKRIEEAVEKQNGVVIENEPSHRVQTQGAVNGWNEERENKLRQKYKF